MQEDRDMDVAEPTVAQRTLQHRLADLPESATPHIKMGYALLGKLDKQRLTDVVGYVTSNFAKRSRYDSEVAADISGIDKNIVGDLLSAVALTVGSVFDIDVSKSDFFLYAPRDLVDKEVRPVVEEILDIAIRQKGSLQSEFEKARIANAVLPSYRYLEHAIDVRLTFDSAGKIASKVPLAVFYLVTDSEENIWFQTSPADLEDLLDKLQKAKQSINTTCSAIGDWR